ncbi:hypothetical protein HNP84_004670 [Thermocatellispora tengchongensis]|uniref:HNH endonuclease n=1 Tax=Thermocatellispora tengchongensis TaxID=1073253 RepID=A0A840P8J5_9ACTN|nr:HNH endonuclease domain-containing protein [Thermocatellispora tengchongensis]MBB5134936.1 hypothetical protein [Thermocatellispora tengchongensis]
MNEDFFRYDPSARASWRLAVLMGRNSRTYKFALGSALMSAAAEGRTEIPLAELAVPYAMGLARRVREAAQMPAGGELGESDFLAVAQREADESLRIGTPTEELLSAAVRSMPQMVMRKFHNLPGGGEVPHRFYELTGGSRERVVRLTEHLRSVARSEHAPSLREELDARWSIVEASFSAAIGRSLMQEGVAVDLGALRITDKRRRRPVAGVTEAVIGFQHGRCLICDETLVPGVDAVAVDHVFPFSMMARLGAATDLDAVWNLAPAHSACNGRKSDRPPTTAELVRLAERNEAIMHSPLPLRKTLHLTLVRHGYPGRAGDWRRFLAQAQRDLPG